MSTVRGGAFKEPRPDHVETGFHALCIVPLCMFRLKTSRVNRSSHAKNMVSRGVQSWGWRASAVELIPCTPFSFQAEGEHFYPSLNFREGL